MCVLFIHFSEELERDVEFEVIGDAPDKAPPPQANQEEVNNIANGNKASSQQSTSAEGRRGSFDKPRCLNQASLMFLPLPPSVPAQEDDVMIVDSDAEEEASSSSAAAAATGAAKRKHRGVDSEPSVKRPRTDQSTTPADDDDEVMELD